MAYSNNNFGGYGGEYTTTSYGAQGGGDGGGFMAGSQPNGSQGDKEKQPIDKLRPCTILQIQTAERLPGGGETFVVDGEKLGFVSLVGQIRAVARQAISVNYTLDDGTGSIEGRKFATTDRPTHDDEGNPLPEPAAEAALAVGQWARVYGKPRQLGNNPKHSFNITSMKPITDKNEISHHLLEATYLHLYYSKGPLDGAGAGGAGADGGGGGGVKQEDGLFVQQGGSDLTGVGNSAKRVYAWMQKQPYSNEGHHAQAISAALGIPFNEVMAAGDELHSVGRIFETVDSQTWNILET